MGGLFFKKGTDKFTNVNIKNFKEIEVTDIDGNLKKVGDYLQNKKLLIIVNTASSCGYTNSNYKQLVDLYTKYSPQGLEILGFPCNQFMSQESKCEIDIKNYTKNKFKVEFPLFSKIDVNGPNTHQLFIHLKKNHKDFNIDSQNLKNIPWNFAKFLVDTNGKVIAFYSPDTEPSNMEKEIEKNLI